MSPGLAVAVVGATLVAGIAATVLLESVAAAVVGGERWRVALAAPWRRAALLAVQQRVVTEHPDPLLRSLAPVLYLGLAAGAVAVVPLARGVVPVDAAAGIVLWGTIEAMVVVAVFLHGWAANAPMPLLGGYRFVAAGLAVLLLSMFVLIAAALPAESLRVRDLVESQAALWNVVRQPLGLPLFVVVALCLSLWRPLDFADAGDLAGGTTSEVSGPARLVWAVARRAMLVAFAGMTATVLLGGYLGPGLPGPVWLALKTAVVLALLVGLGAVLPRVLIARFVRAAWLLLLPLSFVHLLIAGVESLP